MARGGKPVYNRQMELSADDTSRLAQAKLLFATDTITREQAQFALSRKLSNTEWVKYSRVPKVKPPIKDYSLSKLFPETKPIKALHQIVAKQAAHVALAKRSSPEIEAKRALRKSKGDQPELHIKSLFKPHKDEFTITKTKTYYNRMYNSKSSIWKISGEITLFNVNKPIQQLVSEMMNNASKNFKVNDIDAC